MWSRSGFAKVEPGTSLLPRNYHGIVCHEGYYIYFSTNIKIVLPKKRRDEKVCIIGRKIASSQRTTNFKGIGIKDGIIMKKW
jgi:hypothetical protein